jgi:hypothetical protein
MSVYNSGSKVDKVICTSFTEHACHTYMYRTYEYRDKNTKLSVAELILTVSEYSHRLQSFTVTVSYS